MTDDVQTGIGGLLVLHSSLPGLWWEVTGATKRALIVMYGTQPFVRFAARSLTVDCRTTVLIVLYPGFIDPDDRLPPRAKQLHYLLISVELYHLGSFENKHVGSTAGAAVGNDGENCSTRFKVVQYFIINSIIL